MHIITEPCPDRSLCGVGSFDVANYPLYSHWMSYTENVADVLYRFPHVALCPACALLSMTGPTNP
jgi:hypothetical protein